MFSYQLPCSVAEQYQNSAHTQLIQTFAVSGLSFLREEILWQTGSDVSSCVCSSSKSGLFRGKGELALAAIPVLAKTKKLLVPNSACPLFLFRNLKYCSNMDRNYIESIYLT